MDFINQEIAAGQPLAQAVIRAASIRARPIVLTGLAAMIGAFFILDDPIFNGLAISLIFGILVSTALTLLLIPLLYYGYIRRSTRAPFINQGGYLWHTSSSSAQDWAAFQPHSLCASIFRKPTASR